LVEALVEVRWGEGGHRNPAYPIIVGRLYERLRSDYPEIEDLSLATNDTDFERVPWLTVYRPGDI
jgi:hypothetical protein